MWIENARVQCDGYAIIVGNKSDDPNRQVSTKDAISFALQSGMPYFETSAKNADVDKIFDHLAQRLLFIELQAKRKSRAFSQSRKITLTDSERTSRKYC